MVLISYQRAIQMKAAGCSETEIADALGITTSELRGLFAAIREGKKAAEESRQQAHALKDEGLSIPAIARVMGISDSPGMPAKQKVKNLLKSKRKS